MNTVESITLSNPELTRFFFALISLLVLAQLFGYIFNRCKLLRVAGEIFGGFLLGPTILGHFFLDAHNWLFNAFEAEGKLISVIYWFGLILLMFVSGFEVQKTFDREDIKIIVGVFLGSTSIPVIAGWMAPLIYNFSPYIGEKQNMTALKIIVMIAVAITSIPVISRIFMDLKVTNTRFAKIVLTVATAHDIVLWVAMAVATGLVSAEPTSVSNISVTVSITIAFFCFTIACMPKVINWSNGAKYNFLIKSSVAGYVLSICFIFSALAGFLNVNIVFGALLAGIVVGLMPNKEFEKETLYIKEISLSFFIPIYFAVIGLKLDLIHHFNLKFFGWFLVFSSIVQIGGTVLGAKLIKKDWLSSVNFGIAMNARGGPGIVLATVAFDLSIINETFFVTLVLVAILTSLMTGFWFKYVLSRGWELLKAT